MAHQTVIQTFLPVFALVFGLPGQVYVLTDAIVSLNYNVTSPATAFTAPAVFGPGTHDYTLLPQSSFQFTPGATYWLDLSANSGAVDGLAWFGSEPAVTAAGIATAAGYRCDNGIDPPQRAHAVAKATFQIDGGAATATKTRAERRCATTQTTQNDRLCHIRTAELATLLLIGLTLLAIGAYNARK